MPSSQPSSQPPSTPSEVPWSRYDVGTALLLAYFVVPLVTLQLQHHGFFKFTASHSILFHQTLSLLTWFVILWQIRKKYTCDVPSLIGLRLSQPWFDTLSQYIKYSTLGIIATLALILTLSILQPTLGPLPSPYKDLSTNELKTIALLALCLAPVLEEVVFRGFVQTTLMKYHRPWIAVLLTSSIFTLLHSLYLDTPIAMVSTFFLSNLLGYVRFRSNTLYPGITVHLFNNTLATLALKLW